MTTREIYNRCYRAWRENATYAVMDLWRDHREIYRAAGDSYVMNVDDLQGWLNQNRHWRFLCRRMDLQDAS